MSKNACYIPGVSTSLVLRPQTMNGKDLVPERVGVLTSIVVGLVVAKLGLPTVCKHYKKITRWKLKTTIVCGRGLEV